MLGVNAEVLRAIKLRDAGQHTEALAILLDLRKVSPDDPKLNYEIACTYDPQGLEADAVPFYERALEGGLGVEDRRGALLGLGSAYRSIERFADAVRTLERGFAEFPHAPEFEVFLGLALYSMGDYRRAVQTLLRHVATHPGHEHVAKYQRAIHFYAEQPDPPYEE